MGGLVLACMALELSHDKDPADAERVCSLIEQMAPLAGLDPYEIAALAWRESRFEPDVVSRSGCMGTMQVNPTWSPYNSREIATHEGSVAAGVLAILYWKEREGDKWMHCYNSGNTCYAPRYVRQIQEIRADLLLWDAQVRADASTQIDPNAIVYAENWAGP